MELPKFQNLERLDALESKVLQAVETVAELSSRCEHLAVEKSQLERSLRDLRKRNNDLTQQIVELRAMNEADSGESADGQRILNRIDRMLEKFGELQV